MSASLFSRLSIFSYSNVNRIDGKQVITNTFGGILTLVVIAIILFAAVIKTNEMFRKTNIITKSTSYYDFKPPLINLSTTPNDDINTPFMFGIQLFQHYNESGDYYYVSALGEYIQQTESQTKTTSFELQNCTEQHFWAIPDIKNNALQWGISNWLCLPLDNVYQIGGSSFSKNYKRLKIVLNCTGVWCGQSKTYTLGRFIDATGDQPSTYYLNKQIVMTTVDFAYGYLSKLQTNKLITDDSLLPIQQLTTSYGIQPKPSAIVDLLINSQNTTITIQMSNNVVTYKRSYMKLLDVISFIGGIANIMLAAGILVAGFNRYYFQMSYASKYFRQKTKKDMGFISYLKTISYKTFEDTFLNLKWQETKNQCETIDTVNKMLDIININKRIVFLEEAINLLFEKHQLKGLHLIHSMTQQEADKHIEEHKLRLRLMHYIVKSKKIKEDKIFIFKTEDAFQNNLIQSIRDLKHNSNQSNVKINSQNIQNELREIQMVSRKQKRHFAIQKSKDIQIRDAKKNSYPIEYMPTMEYQQSFLKMQEELDITGDIAEEDLNKDELIRDLDSSLKRFIVEGQTASNSLTARIYAKVDSGLKLHLRLLIRSRLEERRQGEELAIRLR